MATIEKDVELPVAPGTEASVVEGALAVEVGDRAAIDMQVATAKRYPRSVDKALKEALTLATLDEETAASMFYALPRDGKRIEGPSARLAEIMAYAWGNLRAEADIVGEDQTHITAMGTCFDLERNVAIRVRVRRRITDKHGRRFSEDMIGVTGNAAISIALRNAVFKVIPQTFVRRIYQAARQASLGKGGTIQQKRQAALEWFGKLGVTPDQIFSVLGVRGLDDIGEEELIVLRGLRTAIQDGETTVEQAFPPTSGSVAKATRDRIEELKRRMNGAGAGSSATESRDRAAATSEQGTSPASRKLKTLESLYVKAVAEHAPELRDDADALRIWEDWATGKARDQWAEDDYRTAIAKIERREGLGRPAPVLEEEADQGAAKEA